MIHDMRVFSQKMNFVQRSGVFILWSGQTGTPIHELELEEDSGSITMHTNPVDFGI